MENKPTLWTFENGESTIFKNALAKWCISIGGTFFKNST